MNTANSAKLLTFPNANGLVSSFRAKAFVFSDPKSHNLLNQARRVATSDASVLIVGETGTGKELVARHIHEESTRKGPFVAVDCGAFSETLAEAELFGHEIGAFTGAQQARPGWFEAANGGTLFLDEVANLSLAMQARLLRVLQEREVVRIGSRKPLSLDVRLVAASNVDLEQMVKTGHFRQDLYYRLNVASVRLPPLRERQGDILPLVHHFIEVYRRKLDLPQLAVSPAAEQDLRSYKWPGNIRELENVIHFALIVCQGDTIQPTHLRLPHLSVNADREGGMAIDTDALLASLDVDIRRLLESGRSDVYESVQRVLVTAAYDSCRENQVRTAQRLGISRNILRSHLKRFGLLGERAFKALE